MTVEKIDDKKMGLAGPSKNGTSWSLHSTLFRSVGSLRGPTEFRKS